MKARYSPNFDISENMLRGIESRKVGDKVKFFVDYYVIEKTKSYVVFRINFAYLDTNKRKL